MINFIPKDYKINEAVTPSIKFSDSDGYMDATIYIDHVPIAYFDTDTGGLNLVAFETGSYYTSDGDMEEIKYLESKGIILKTVKIDKTRSVTTIMVGS